MKKLKVVGGYSLILGGVAVGYMLFSFNPLNVLLPELQYLTNTLYCAVAVLMLLGGIYIITPNKKF